MDFSLDKSIELLERTPLVYESLFRDTQSAFDAVNEGAQTWNAHNIIGHLIYGEITDWIPRAQLILDQNIQHKTFSPYDRFAQDRLFHSQSTNQLLDEYKSRRFENIQTLKSWKLTDEQLLWTGIHPDLGIVTLKELISTWTIHDLVHINQISRVLVKHYQSDIGPWIKYVGFLNN